MTLYSLKDPKNGSDQQSKEVATGFSFLAKVIFYQGGSQSNLIKAEMLTRESLRIRILLDDSNHMNVG
jgi:hypothetical protein